MNRLDQYGSSLLPRTVDTLSLSGDVAVNWLPAPGGVINLEGARHGSAMASDKAGDRGPEFLGVFVDRLRLHLLHRGP